MPRLLLSSLAAGLFLSCPTWALATGCDLNNDGAVDTADVQAAVNMTFGTAPCTASIAGPNSCTALMVQRVINASMGQACLVSTGPHVVALNWTASTSAGVTGYQISRGLSATGPFTLIGTVSGSTTSYTDLNVLSGQTYYYVVAAVAGLDISATQLPQWRSCLILDLFQDSVDTRGRTNRRPCVPAELSHRSIISATWSYH